MDSPLNVQTCGRSMASANVLLNCSGPSVANTAQFSVVIPGILRLSREVRLKYTAGTSHSFTLSQHSMSRPIIHIPIQSMP